MSTTIRVSAIQTESNDGGIGASLKHATSLVNEAAARGAKLILLPEYMPTGCAVTPAIWGRAEATRGPTVDWLRENSGRQRVWLGTTFLEAEGEHFFNTFVLTDPNGHEAGRVRKCNTSGPETFFVRGTRGSHVIDTDFGKLGVGICYDNYFSHCLQMMQSQSVDMVLMPMDHADVNAEGKKLAHLYARLLGVPVVMANGCGTAHYSILGLSLLRLPVSLFGMSTIVDSDGNVKAQLGRQEGVIVEDVTLDPSRKSRERPQCYGRWALKVSLGSRLFLVYEAFGQLSYALNFARKRSAERISSLS
jgi:N-carbamoylputrescine amidase